MFSLYLAMGQNAFHGLDAFSYLKFVHNGELHNQLNLLYQPLAWVFARLCGFLACRFTSRCDCYLRLAARSARRSRTAQR